MDWTGLAKLGLAGWRQRVADGVTGPVAGRTSLSEDQVQAIVGAAFFALSVYYVSATATRALRQLRG